MIKAFKQKGYCPTQLKAIYIDKTSKSVPTNAMLRGSYFEHLCLDAGHAHDDVPVTDLPRLKSGAKSVDQQRIEAQAEAFKKLVAERPIKVHEKQVQITIPYDENYELNGTIDFIGSMDGEITLSIFDLKLTSSIYHEHNYDGGAPWSWEFPHNMDFTQAYMYNYLVNEQLHIDAPFYYMVFDYKPNSEYKIILKKVERMHKAELMESIRKTIEKIDLHKATQWGYNPGYKNCNNCPLKESCTERILQKPIQII